ncbi:7-carboxy-7-deazaguanine synthase QueE [Methanonatronarchaeum sp. AMET-Sl]|uniref:7-carboxy-7-deazaguanine synthase QueE n=1 Tax=Methanonatronarchaeum sp. AMET-Sl TaxID=3037654 RepID=UPI00244DCAB7|nr:7-carboxy-7-deazaguanine synthase QueE [Methanonatronarchaeum sp. AMET-Sl]WGI17006.1 7-carboxy-7-deazaguanine synthase QueE [Methanonatronarchaeum sp. AMET-Sl]
MKIEINNIFESIQGEGRYIGRPGLFIRTSGCNLQCSWCDTDHNKEREITINKLTEIISDSDKDIVVWTGGEPSLQTKAISKVIEKTSKKNHLETNATNNNPFFLKKFDYVSFSPKNVSYAKKIPRLENTENDVKIVTDLKKVGIELIKYASILMPLTTGDTKTDREIKQRVWRYCVENNIVYSPRAHIEVWGNKEEKELKNL